MAILQLSRITHRKGLGDDLPQLKGAELGWSLDKRKLFIGNGTIADGAPLVGNTEVLTEFSDILSLASTYTYKGLAAGYVASTGLNAEAVVRSLQSKFDDMASVKEFGAVGDGATDDTAAINRALYEIFCREINVEVRRSLYFPAGTYLVSDTIKIPPHAKLYGEGLTSSIIKYVPPIISVTAMVTGKSYAVSNFGDTTWAGIINPVTVNTIDVTIAIGDSVNYTGTGTVREVTPYVVETSDSDHNTGANMGASGGQTPTGIEMASMAVYSTEMNTLLRLDSVTNSGFHYVGLHGPDFFDPLEIDAGTSAISIASSVSSTYDVTVSKLDTYRTTYALRAEGDTKGVVLENSGINYHYQGVYLYNPTVVATATVASTEYKIIKTLDTDFTAIGAANNNVGTTFTATGAGTGSGTVINLDIASPTGVTIAKNIFDNVAQEGVHFHNVLYNSTSHNVFYNVGNALGATAVSPVIHMETDKCISVGDMFEREDESIHPRIALNGNGGIALDSTHSIHLGSFERQVGLEAVLPGNTSGDIFLLAEGDSNSFKIDYSIARTVSGSIETRMGWLYVSNNSTIATYNEEFTESAALNVALTVTGTGTNSTVQYTTTGAEDTTFNYSIVRFD